MLPKSYPKLCEYGKLEENKPKNQCDEIIPCKYRQRIIF